MVRNKVYFPNFHVSRYTHTKANNNKISMPVQPKYSIYANFKHVTGVPAGKGESGVSLNKLRILNAIISRVSTSEKQPAQSEVKETVTNENVDKLIHEYRKKLHTIAKKTAPHFQTANTFLATNLDMMA